MSVADELDAQHRAEVRALVGMYVGAFLLVLVGFLVFAWFEAGARARAYNRVTGADVTTWEALWLPTVADGDR